MNFNQQQEQLKSLKEKGDKLNNLANKINTEIEFSQGQLKTIQEKCLQLYNTSDIEELKKILSDLKDKNEKIILQAEKDIQRLEVEVIETKDNIEKIKSSNSN